jgi:hypothetical protein
MKRVGLRRQVEPGSGAPSPLAISSSSVRHYRQVVRPENSQGIRVRAIGAIDACVWVYTWVLARSRLRGRCRAVSGAGGSRSGQRSRRLPIAVRGSELGSFPMGHVVSLGRAAGPTSRRPSSCARPLSPPVGTCHLPRRRSTGRLALVCHWTSSTRGSWPRPRPGGRQELHRAPGTKAGSRDARDRRETLPLDRPRARVVGRSPQPLASPSVCVASSASRSVIACATCVLQRTTTGSSGSRCRGGASRSRRPRPAG